MNQRMMMNQKNNTFSEIAGRLMSSDRVFVTTHRNPEGDAIGSSLALMVTLERLGKQVRFSLDDPVPHPLGLLPQSHRAQPNITPTEDELVVVLDCPNVDRISSPFAYVDRHRAVINIDHHLDNSYFGELNYVDPKACAAGELLYFVLKEMVNTVDLETAFLIYTAILTDTGSFRFANTNENAFKISCELVKSGLDPHHIAQIVYENNSITKMRLLGHVLMSMETSPDAKVGWISVTRDVFDRYNARDTDMEGFVNYPRYIEGVIVSILFHELDHGKTKVSFRSKGEANVAEFASRYGGGGHKNAAACVITGPLSVVKERIISELLDEMQRTGLES